MRSASERRSLTWCRPGAGCRGPVPPAAWKRRLLFPVVASLVAGLGIAAGAPGVVGEDGARPGSVTVVGQARSPRGPVAARRFRYDEASGTCVDADGHVGYNRSTREELRRIGDAECADFTGVRVNLTYLRLHDANLRGANFAGVPWYLGAITDSDLTGADLSRTTGEMDYRGSRLRKADLSGADLHAADLDGADLRGARFNRHTRLPFDHDEALRRGMVFVPAPE